MIETMISAAILLAIATLAPTAGPSARLEADARAVERAVAALKPHLDNIWPDGKPGTAVLITAQWQAIQRWAADWLDAHPGATGPALVKAASARFGDDWTFSAVRLGRGEMLVSAARWQIGNASILSSGADGNRVRWSTADRQLRLNGEADRSLASWRAAAQPAVCPKCVMMGGSAVGVLPPMADGTMRFWIEGGYAREMGGTGGVQFSIWSWRNGRAQPLLVQDALMSDQPLPVLRGSTLFVASKGDWSSIFACGSCSGRTVDLPFAIEPSRVRALPAISRTPEIDLVDRVFARILKGQPVNGLATPSATAVIRRELRDTMTDKDPQLRLLVGMVNGWQRWAVRGERWACLSADGIAPMAFAFDHNLTRITAVRMLAGNACQGDGTQA